MITIHGTHRMRKQYFLTPPCHIKFSQVVDDPEAKQYPMPLTATGQFDVEVGPYISFTRL